MVRSRDYPLWQVFTCILYLPVLESREVEKVTGRRRKKGLGTERKSSLTNWTLDKMSPFKEFHSGDQKA